MMGNPVVTIARPQRNRRGGVRRDRRSYHEKVGLFALPGLVYLLLFALYPMYQLVLMSLSDVSSSNILGTWTPNGVSNFQSTVSSPSFSTVVSNTLILVVSLLVMGLVGGTISALALQRNGVLVRITMGFMVFVWALPPVVAGNLWRFLLSSDGAVNSILISLGVIKQPILWLIDTKLALLSIILISGWLVLPFSTLVIRSALLDVPQDLLEAAELDGAGSMGRFRYVALPHIKSTVLVLGILLVVYAFRSFDLIFVMTGGGPAAATTTLPYLTYVQAFESFQFGIGAATAVLSMLIVLVLAFVYARVSRGDKR
jgi:ABC-type sugar transport system permease subunit